MKIIVLDRDGVINQDSDAYIKHPDEWVPETGSLEAILKLKKAGWVVAIATNQSGIRRGFYNHATLSAMHQKLNTMLQDLAEASAKQSKDLCPLGLAKVDWISFSPYLADDNSVCRKPLGGMLQAIENRFQASLAGMPMIGDTLNDVRAAQSKNMMPYFVKTGKGQTVLDKQDSNTQLALANVPIHSHLLSAVEAILK